MDEAEIARLMREAREASRGYASFFGWAPDRDLEEYGPVKELALAAAKDGEPLFEKIRIRGRGNDPPDLEAIDPSGSRVAIEVTELVDGAAIQAFKAGRSYDWAEWNRSKFLNELDRRLVAKANRRASLKEGPYPGGYLIVVFTDEPGLRRDTVETYLRGQQFNSRLGGAKAYLLLSYDPETEDYPFFQLHNAA